MNGRIRYEQAVYGSFPFWDRGYATWAHSPGCRPEWLDWLGATCPRIGPPPPGESTGGLCALRPDRETWAIIGTYDQGTDDRGRPGAVAFHALFLSARDHRELDGDPFRLAHRLRRDWGPDDRDLDAVIMDLPSPDTASTGEADEKARQLTSRIARGERIGLPSKTPIDELAREVWRALPRSVRLRATLATWTNATDLGCNLAAGPAFPHDPGPVSHWPWSRILLVSALT